MRKYDDLVLNATHLCCCHHHSILSLSSTITHTHTNTHIFTTPLLSKTADRCTITLTVVFQVYLYSMEPRLNEVSQVPKIFLTYRNLSFLGTQMEKLLGWNICLSLMRNSLGWKSLDLNSHVDSTMVILEQISTFLNLSSLTYHRT